MTTNAASEVIERVEYTYDAFDRRITRDVDRFNQLGQPVTERTAYLWNDGQIQLELTSDGKITRNYFNGPVTNEILATDLAVIDGAETTWLMADTTGAIRTLLHEQTTGDWNVVHRLFDSFGEPTPRPNATDTVDPSLLGETTDAVLTSVPTFWQGHTLDTATQLYNAEARWYDPATGNFLTEDPMGFAAGDYNLHRYALGSPTNFMDADGRIADYIWDGASIAIGYWSLKQSIARGDVFGTVIDAVGIGVDSLAFALPFIPGGVGLAVRATRGGVEGIVAANYVRQGVNTGQTVLRTIDTGVQSVSTINAFSQGDAFGTTLGLVGLGIRRGQLEDFTGLYARSGDPISGLIGYSVSRTRSRASTEAFRQGYDRVFGSAPSTPVQRRTLYHYTDEAGLGRITESNSLRASTKASNPSDVRYGNGQYVSDFVPGTKTPAQLSRGFLGQPFQGKRFSHYIEIDVTDLQVIQGRNGVFVIPNDVPLDLTGRVIGSGRVPSVKPGG